jgi:hypothetical protein
MQVPNEAARIDRWLMTVADVFMLVLIVSGTMVIGGTLLGFRLPSGAAPIDLLPLEALTQALYALVQSLALL